MTYRPISVFCSAAWPNILASKWTEATLCKFLTVQQYFHWFIKGDFLFRGLARLFDLIRTTNCRYSYSGISVSRPAARMSRVEKQSLKNERDKKVSKEKLRTYICDYGLLCYSSFVRGYRRFGRTCVSIFKIEVSCWYTFWCFRWDDLSKRRYLPTKLHGLATQRAVILIVTFLKNLRTYISNFRNVRIRPQNDTTPQSGRQQCQ
jgi:hypothetical protein